jgi:hypothetical protein
MNEIIKQSIHSVSREDFYQNKRHNEQLFGISYTGDLSDLPDGYYQFIYDANVISIKIETDVTCTISATSNDWDSILKIIF